MSLSPTEDPHSFGYINISLWVRESFMESHSSLQGYWELTNCQENGRNFPEVSRPKESKQSPDHTHEDNSQYANWVIHKKMQKQEKI